MGERPPQPMPEDMSRQTRLEDLPEFLKLAPEQQEKVLAARERMMAEAMSPQHVVTRSIEDMGFWKGMGETIKPHLKKQKEIMFKELKANASLALSLIPVIGEGKGLGTGLLGITKNADLAWKDVSAAAFASKAIKFEPAVRLSKAARYAKTAFNSGRSVNAIVHVKGSVEALKAAEEVYKNMPKVGWAKDLLYRSKTAARDIFSIVTSPFNVKNVGAASLAKDYSMASEKGTRLLAKNMMEKAGVRGVSVLQKRAELGAKVAYIGKLTEAGLTHDVKWYNLVDKWKYRGALRSAKTAAKEVTDKTTLLLDAHLADRMLGKNIIQKGIESRVLKAAPKAIEKTASISKSIVFKNFFERWLNLTPDVPHWISYTTGIAEFLGAHGIDAVPAVMQMGINRYKSVMVSKDMALDVLGYTVKRGLGKIAERQQAAAVFSPTA